MPVVLSNSQSGLAASQRLRVAYLLAAVGGYLDAYTYFERGGVFANAQTGNIMIEVHNNPQEAWTDAKQQITPKDLKDMLEQLEIPNENSNNNLVEYRMQIDEIDDQILSLIKQRFNITKMVGEWKKKNNVSVFQQNRYDEILKKNEIRSKRYNIELDLINSIFNIIHEKSVEQQLEANEEK